MGCSDGGSKTPPPPPPQAEGDLEIDSPAEIAALLSATGWNGNPGEEVSVDGNVLHFNMPSGKSTDNQGFKIDFPADAKGAGYLSVEVTFKVVEVTALSIQGGPYPASGIADTKGNAKIGFKSAIAPTEDVTPYDDHELIFGTIDTALGVEKTQAFTLFQPNKLPNDAIYINHNKYGTGSLDPLDYKLEVTKIVFRGGEPSVCCTDCSAECADCDAGICIDKCNDECCILIDFNTINPAALTFNLALNAVEGVEIASGITTAPAAEADDSGANIVFSFDPNNQLGLIKLSKYQQALVLAAANANATLKINLQGSSDSATSQYRYILGNPEAGSNWNGTAPTANAIASELIGEKTIGWGNKNLANFGYFILQNRIAGASAFTVTAVTIKIELPEACAVCGKIPCECPPPDPNDTAAGKGELDAALNAQYTRVGTKVFSLAEWITGKTALAAPLKAAGSPTYTFKGNGINVTGRTNDFNGIDYMIKDTDLAALIVTNRVKITVYGMVIGVPPASTQIILGEPAANYGWLNNQTVTAENGTFKLAYEIAADYLTNGGDATKQPQNDMRIQTNSAAATVDFRITLIEVENLGVRDEPVEPSEPCCDGDCVDCECGDDCEGECCEEPVVPGDVTDGMTSILRGTAGLPHYVNASGDADCTATADGITVTVPENGYDGLTITPQAGGGSAPSVWTIGQKIVVRGRVDTLGTAEVAVDMVLQGTTGGYGTPVTDAGKNAGDTFELVIEITSENVTAITTDGNLTVRAGGDDLIGGQFTITGLWVKLP